MKLRQYQDQAIAAVWEALSPEVNRVAVEMATGLGKTITFAAMIDEWLKDGQGAGRALVLVHTDELVSQAVEKVHIVTRGHWSIGVVKAERDEVDADIVVASVQTVARPERRARIRDVGLIVVDECQHAVSPTYRAILQYYGAFRQSDPVRWPTTPPIPTVGFTATLARTDGQGLGQIFQEMPFSRSLTWGMRKGYLVDLVPYTITIPGLEAGASNEVLDGQLADSIAPEAVVKAWLEHRNGPGGEFGGAPSTVLFAPLVKSAQVFADAFNAAGVKAEVVHGGLAPAERRAVLDRYNAGVTTVVCNAMVLTEGWDSPRTKCVIVARPTQSVPLFVQMVGRGLRPWLASEAPPREDQRCILLCVQGTATTLATVADLSENIGEVSDGVSLLAMEDQWDLGKDIEPDGQAWTGPVRVEQWDPLVQRSSRAWKYTIGGAPFLPTAKRGQGYVFIVPVGEEWEIWARSFEPMRPVGQQHRSHKLAQAPDLELAMALAEDEAQERGGDIGALLADKGRAWRKQRPSEDLLDLAARLGLQADVDRIMASKAGGKAGKVSDLVERMTASRVLDPIVNKIKERGSER